MFEHVIFDCFGTLFWTKDDPYKRSIEHSRPLNKSDVVRQALIKNYGYHEWCIEHAVFELQNPVFQVHRFLDTVDIVTWLQEREISWSVMSNLSQPYGMALLKDSVISQAVYLFFSYADGMKKPDPKYYQHAIQTLGISSDRILFVGDSMENDVLYPSKQGFQTLHARKDNASLLQQLKEYYEPCD